MIWSRIDGNNIFTFENVKELILFFLTNVFVHIIFYVSMFIGFCLFMAWFVKDPVGHILNGLTFLETLCQ